MKRKTNKTDNYSDSSTDEEWLESGDSLDYLTDERESDNDDTDEENYDTIRIMRSFRVIM